MRLCGEAACKLHAWRGVIQSDKIPEVNDTSLFAEGLNIFQYFLVVLCLWSNQKSTFPSSCTNSSVLVNSRAFEILSLSLSFSRSIPKFNLCSDLLAFIDQFLVLHISPPT